MPVLQEFPPVLKISLSGEGGGGGGRRTPRALFFRLPKLNILLSSFWVGVYKILQVTPDKIFRQAKPKNKQNKPKRYIYISTNKKGLVRIYARTLPKCCWNTAQIRYIGFFLGGGGHSSSPPPVWYAYAFTICNKNALWISDTNLNWSTCLIMH